VVIGHTHREHKYRQRQNNDGGAEVGAEVGDEVEDEIDVGAGMI
jgi:hypothetical protein